jgi:YHS domain-containing protein/positive regulator of sigma E activity
LYFVLRPFSLGGILKETGRVIWAEGGVAKVEFVPKEACEHCGSKGFCHPAPASMVAEVTDGLGVKVGDDVTIETGEGASVQAAAMVFLLPIVGLIIGYLLGRAVWGRQGAGLLCGLGMMAVVIGLVAYLDRRVLKAGRFMPGVVSVARREVEGMAKDPVCGMEVSEKTELKSDYKGKTYYFCAKGCKIAFDKNPDEHLKKQERNQN